MYVSSVCTLKLRKDLVKDPSPGYALVLSLVTVVPYLGSRRVGGVPLSVRLLVHLS
jgi:hypothetical protein